MIDILSEEYNRIYKEINNKKFDIKKIYIRKKSDPITFIVLINNDKGCKVKIDTKYNSLSVEKDNASYGVKLDNEVIQALFKEIKNNKNKIDKKSIAEAINYRLKQAKEILDIGGIKIDILS